MLGFPRSPRTPPGATPGSPAPVGWLAPTQPASWRSSRPSGLASTRGPQTGSSYGSMSWLEGLLPGSVYRSCTGRGQTMGSPRSARCWSSPLPRARTTCRRRNPREWWREGKPSPEPYGSGPPPDPLCRSVEPNEGREKEGGARWPESASTVTRTETGRSGPLLQVVVARGLAQSRERLAEALRGGASASWTEAAGRSGGGHPPFGSYDPARPPQSRARPSQNLPAEFWRVVLCVCRSKLCRVRNRLGSRGGEGRGGAPGRSV